MTISVIIPTLNEEGHLPGTLRSLRELMTAGLIHEVLVIDGGSHDRTVAMALEVPGVSVHSSGRGRAIQMNMGLRLATGRVVIFLHADTRLEPGAIQEMQEALADPSVVGGAFRFCLGGRQCLFSRMLERGVAIRCQMLQLPYGDQALFVRRCVCLKVGGFATLPALEDVDLVQRLRRMGRLAMLQSRAVTSDRAWRQRGAVQSVVNVGCLVALTAGIRPRTLANLYARWRGWGRAVAGGSGVPDSPARVA